MQQLAADPEWVARHAQMEQLRAATSEDLRHDEAPLIAALHKAGVNVNSVWDLVNMPAPYPFALPVLAAHLDRPYAPRNLEGIARALAVKEARAFAWEKVWELVTNRWPELAEDFRAGLMTALSGMATADDLPKMISLITDRRYGPSRVLIVSNLTRSRRKEARQALLDLKTDPDLQKEIAYRLKTSI
ncbi:hypothetical protein [Microvirga guangxiensis]|nr:hypothetical protein [Microvirga guangxiensis]